MRCWICSRNPGGPHLPVPWRPHALQGAAAGPVGIHRRGVVGRAPRARQTAGLPRLHHPRTPARRDDPVAGICRSGKGSGGENAEYGRSRRRMGARRRGRHDAWRCGHGRQGSRESSFDLVRRADQRAYGGWPGQDHRRERDALGLGRKIHDIPAYQNLLRQASVNVLRPALGLNSLTKIKRIAALAETHYVAVAPYHEGGPIGTMAGIHLAAALPNSYAADVPAPAADRDAPCAPS